MGQPSIYQDLKRKAIINVTGDQNPVTIADSCFSAGGNKYKAYLPSERPKGKDFQVQVVSNFVIFIEKIL